MPGGIVGPNEREQWREARAAEADSREVVSIDVRCMTANGAALIFFGGSISVNVYGCRSPVRYSLIIRSGRNNMRTKRRD